MSIETDILGCSIRCNEEASCCSFEYSPTENYCNLNKDCLPTVAVHKDYAFCTKGNIAHRNQILNTTMTGAKTAALPSYEV